MNSPAAVGWLTLGAVLFFAGAWLAAGHPGTRCRAQADVRAARRREVPDQLGAHFAGCPDGFDWHAAEQEMQQ